MALLSAERNHKPAALGTVAREAILYFVVGLGLVAVPGLVSAVWQRFVHGSGDFLQLYTGAVLVGTDGLYSLPANHEVQRRLAGFRLEGVHYVRLPFYAAVFRPLAGLPYPAAYWVFQLISVAGVIGFLKWSRAPRLLKAGSLLFVPLVYNFLAGQDMTLVLALFTAALLLQSSGREAAGGLILSLCIIKFSLFVLVPLVLLRHRKWRMIAGAAAGVFALLALSTVVAGPDWPRQYLALLSGPAMTPHPEQMPNVRGILFGSPLAGFVMLLVLGFFLYALAREGDFELSLAIALAGGLLLSIQSYLHDCVILLPALIIAVQRGNSRVRFVALLLLTPVPYFLLATGHGVVFLLCVLALVVARILPVTKPREVPCAA